MTDYIRGQRDGMERAAEIVKRLPDKVRYEFFIEAHQDLTSMGMPIRVPESGPHQGKRVPIREDFEAAIRAEAAKLPVDDTDWQARVEKVEADLAWLALRVAQDDDRFTAAESALAAMTERCRALEEARDHWKEAAIRMQTRAAAVLTEKGAPDA